MPPARRGKKQQKLEEALPADEQVNLPKSDEEPVSAAKPKKATKKGKGKETTAAEPEEHDIGVKVSRKEAKGKGTKKAKPEDEQPEAEELPVAKKAKKEPKAATAGKGAAATGDKGGLPENTLEQGRVFFMYKPKVVSPGEEPSLSGLNDIQRTYLVLQPEQPSGGKCRMLVLPKKKLPDAGKHERFFAFVEAVGSSPSELTSGLNEEHYTTKTRGERVQPAGRAAGEGRYVIAKGGKSGGVHWGFKLEVPAQPGEAQKVLGIRQEGSYVLSAKNPDKQGQQGAPSAGPPPDYSPQQREKFGGKAWIGVEDTSLLDVPGTELLLVGAKADPIESGELGGGGELLQELSDKEEGQQQLQKAVKGGGKKKGGKDAISMEPAVTGKLK